MSWILKILINSLTLNNLNILNAETDVWLNTLAVQDLEVHLILALLT
jgi:hypothetical protein